MPTRHDDNSIFRLARGVDGDCGLDGIPERNACETGDDEEVTDLDDLYRELGNPVG